MPKVAGDATRLPFGDNVFDAVTISFGLRNVADRDVALREMARVTRPGGRLVVCEFSTPTNRFFATAYKEYLMQALPRVARAVSSNPEAYVYLAESIRAWPDQAALAHQMSRAGWSAVRWRNLTGGIVALHAAYKVQRKTAQLNGFRRSISREASPPPRHARATQSASSSVTRLPITRTAMPISRVERIPIGPVAGKNRGNVSNNASRRATENPRP